MFFRKTNERDKFNLKKRLGEFKIKEVNYVFCDVSELEAKLKEDDKGLLSLSPVNYYALKEKYLRAVFYTSQDYEENYVKFHSVISVRGVDKIISKTDTYKISKDVLVKAYSKVGIIL